MCPVTSKLGYKLLFVPVCCTVQIDHLAILATVYNRLEFPLVQVGVASGQSAHFCLLQEVVPTLVEE